MLTALTFITASLLAAAAAIRAFRSVENQARLAVRAGKALWAEIGLYKKSAMLTVNTSKKRSESLPAGKHAQSNCCVICGSCFEELVSFT
jgi:hypothetical protein